MCTCILPIAMKVCSKDADTVSASFALLFVQNSILETRSPLGGGGFQNVAFLLLSNRTMLITVLAYCTITYIHEASHSKRTTQQNRVYWVRAVLLCTYQGTCHVCITRLYESSHHHHHHRKFLFLFHLRKCGSLSSATRTPSSTPTCVLPNRETAAPIAQLPSISPMECAKISCWLFNRYTSSNNIFE